MHSAVIMRMHLYRTGELISHELPTYRCFANSFACCQLHYCMPYYLIIKTPQNCPTQLSIFRSHQHEVRYLVSESTGDLQVSCCLALAGLLKEDTKIPEYRIYSPRSIPAAGAQTTTGTHPRNQPCSGRHLISGEPDAQPRTRPTGRIHQHIVCLSVSIVLLWATFSLVKLLEAPLPPFRPAPPAAGPLAAAAIPVLLLTLIKPRHSPLFC